MSPRHLNAFPRSAASALRSAPSSQGAEAPSNDLAFFHVDDPLGTHKGYYRWAITE